MLRPSLETRHLLLLCTLDELGSLQAAGRRLHLSPSALSQQLRELEERLGGPLFHRQWRRLSMTAAARRLTDSARGILQELARAEADARRLIEGASGAIRVATACHQSYRWLARVLAAYAKGWPLVEVTVVPEAAMAPYDWLVERKLDIALVAEEIKLHPRVKVSALFKDELVVLVGQSHPWFGRQHIAVPELADQHLWVDDGALQRSSALGRALAKAGDIAPRKLTYVPMTGGVAIEMARANLGITVMPRWAVEPLLATGDLGAVRVGPRGVWLSWVIATRAEDPEPALAAFIQVVREHHPSAGPVQPVSASAKPVSSSAASRTRAVTPNSAHKSSQR